MNKAVSLFSLLAVTLLMVCGDSDNAVGPNGPDNSIIVTYTIVGNLIIVSYPETIYTYSYCDGNQLIVENDTSEAGSDTTSFLLLNNDNLLVIEGDTLTRIGTGSGIQGVWSMAGFGTITIGASTITVSESYSYADMFIEEWDMFPMADNVTATKLSENMVQLTGSISGEVVTISWNAAGDVTYSSSNSQHATGVVYDNPTACPNDEPEWLLLFLDENESVALNKFAAPLKKEHAISRLFKTNRPRHH